MLCTSSLRGGRIQTFLLGDHRELEPPDPMPNSEVKRLIADGSVGLPHVRVGHRQALIPKTPADGWGFFMPGIYELARMFRTGDEMLKPYILLQH